jgi:hypothetical protein
MNNGSPLAKLAYLKESTWTTFGKLVYFRSHEVRIKLFTLPLWAITNKQWMLGTFTEQFKVEEPPYLEGDIVVKAEGETIRIGRLITYQNETGEKTHYMMNLHAVPALRLINALRHAEVEKKTVWLDVSLDDS